MEPIETDRRLPLTELFTVFVDTERLRYGAVETDDAGRFILHISETYNVSSAYSSAETYYVLTPEECRQYARKARKNKQIRRKMCAALLKKIQLAEEGT